MSVPAAVLVVPVDGTPAAFVVAESWEDQERVRVELCRPHLGEEVAAALDRLSEALEDMREAA